jgi:hypothetical protein
MSTITRPRDPLGVAAREDRGDASAERVRDQHHATEPERGGHRFDVVGERVDVVAALAIPVRQAVPAVIERDDAVVRRDDRREVVPDVRLVAETVQQEHRHAFAAPLEQVQLAALGALHAQIFRLHPLILH